MCLAIPMQVMEVDGLNARCEARGVERRVSLLLLQRESVAVGDMVLIHTGQAIQKVAPEEARSIWALFDQVLAMEDASAR